MGNQCCEHDYKKAGFCEWESDEGKKRHFVIKECSKCNDVIENERKSK